LSNSVRELERQKHDLVNKVEERLSQGAHETHALAKQIEDVQQTKGRVRAEAANKRNFRNFEGEMEEYEPVAEENSQDEEGSDGERLCEDTFVDRMHGKPAFGEIDYYRQVVGEEEQWMQQITPRAGGDSMLG
jgi:phage repressor protein C with HTH and peptisase S24 domain